MFHRHVTRLFLLCVAGILIFMTNPQNDKTVAAPEIAAANPLTARWAGPYGGIPPFDKVKISDFKPALEAAMAENLAEIDAIANNTAAPDFDNTIAALERSGQMFDRVTTIYGIWSSNMSSNEFEPIETEMAPLLAAHGDKITQNAALFKRIEAVYQSDQIKKQKPGEHQRLTWLYYTNFVRSGAKLAPEGKKRLSEINQQLAGLFTKFSQNLLGDEGQLYLTITSQAELAGLPQSLIDAAAQAATAKGKAGSWVIRNTRSSIDPFLTYSANRTLREKAWRMFINRGDNGDARDNNAGITQIL